MITKTKHSYYKLEKRFGSIVKIKSRGYKLTIKELVFFSEEEYVINKVTEESTGLGVNVEARDLQELEQLLNEKYDFLNGKIGEWVLNHPNHTLDKVKEWND